MKVRVVAALFLAVGLFSAPVLADYPADCLGLDTPSAPTCGDVSFEGCCDVSGRVVFCDKGQLFCLDCPQGGSECGWKADAGFYDCGGTGADPSGDNPKDCVKCDPPCTEGQICTPEGCQVCVPNCEGKSCGSDGCGGQCGECAGQCVEGVCHAGPGCEPTPDAKGCGGCGCEECVCKNDAWCCTNEWDGQCVDECINDCGGCPFEEKPVNCGDAACKPEESENCSNCPEDCGCAEGQKCYQKACCAPNCDGKVCGDDGCGGSCGTCKEGCPDLEECVEGKCEIGCVSNCTDKECGDDGCGCSCGDCQAGFLCNEAGKCEECVPQCEGKQCGDDGCGGQCGECLDGTCYEGACQSGPGCVVVDGAMGCGGCPCEACTCEADSYCCETEWDSLCVDMCIQDCGGCVNPCGDGTCDAEGGENCETCAADCACQAGQVCQAGVCGCVPNCTDKDCGDDGCGNVCGTCAEGTTCGLDGKCACAPACEGKACGDDGCGAQCGTCEEGFECGAEFTCQAVVSPEAEDDVVSEPDTKDEKPSDGGGDGGGCAANSAGTTAAAFLFLAAFALLGFRRSRVQGN